MTGDLLTLLCERLEGSAQGYPPGVAPNGRDPMELPAGQAARLARAATALAHSEAARDPFMRGDPASAYCLARGITLTAHAMIGLLVELDYPLAVETQGKLDR